MIAMTEIADSMVEKMEKVKPYREPKRNAKVLPGRVGRWWEGTSPPYSKSSLCVHSSFRRLPAPLQIALFLLGCLILAASSLALQISPDLMIEGNQRLATRQILKRLKPGSQLDSLGWLARRDSLQQWAARQALPMMELRDTWREGLLEELRIIEGPLLVMGQLRLTGLNADLPQPDEFLMPGTVLSQGRLQNALRAWLESLERLGRPLTRIVFTDFQLVPEDDKLLLDLEGRLLDAQEVYPGPLLLTSPFATREKTFTALTRLKDGERYDPVALRRARSRLLATGWFEDLTGPALCRTIDGLAWYVKGSERPFYHIDGMLGWLPGSGQESGKLAYHGLLELDNLAGTGRSLHLLASKPDGESQELALRYEEPFLLSSPLGASIEIQQSSRDSSWVELGLETRLFAEWLPGLTTALMLRVAELSPDSLNGYLLLGIDRSTTVEQGVELIADQRDDPRNPRRGWSARLRESRLKRRFSSLKGLPPRHPSRELGIHQGEIQAWLPLHSGFVLSNRIAGGFISGDEPGLEDYFELGGVSGPRGTLDRSIRSSRHMMLQGELRYLLGPESRISLFWDHLRWALPGMDAYRKQNGRGISLVLPVRQGQLEVIYANTPDEALNEGTLHVRLARNF